jgi:hypothetical protein
MSPWLKHIHQTFIKCGMINIWLMQEEHAFNSKWVLTSVKQKLKDIYVNDWVNNLNIRQSCIIYKCIKSKFGLEDYLLKLPLNLSIPFCQFRCNNFKLPIVRGRYNNILRENRFCDLCNDNKLGDEFHLLLECNFNPIHELRKKYLPNYFNKFPSMFKFTSLLEYTSYKKAYNVAKLVKELKTIVK